MNFPENRANILSARLKNPADTIIISADYNRHFFGTEYGFTGAMSRINMYFPMIYDSLLEGRLMMPMVLSAFIVAVAVILLIVGIIIIKFQITVEERV
jgi:hypothetical protein